jgi:hypothetical protein
LAASLNVDGDQLRDVVAGELQLAVVSVEVERVAEEA